MASLRVLGHSFEITLPYVEGHSCTASEASELNRLRVQRITLAARKAIKEAGGVRAREHLEALAKNFTFTAPPYALPSDPAEIEAQKIAAQVVKEALTKQGKMVSPAVYRTMIAEVAQSASVRAEADRRVENTKRVVGEALLDDDFFETGDDRAKEQA